MSKIDVSIIVPTYNGSATLPMLLQSVRFSDTSNNLEIIVCDDGSTEDIHEVLRAHGEGLRLLFLRQERQGHQAAKARNLGINACSGDIILFLDDDVAFDSTFITSHIISHSEVQHPRLVFGFRHRVNMDPVDLRSVSFGGTPNDHRVSILGPRGEAILNSPTPWYFAYTHNLSVSRKSSQLLFDEDFVGWGNEDIDFAYQHWRRGIEIICNPYATVIHLDQSILSDPYHNTNLRRPADFTSAILNTVRMITKYPDDEVLLTRLREDLEGFTIENDRCVPDPSASFVDDIVSWGREKICLRY